jgi:signal transduction histidine kinase
VIAEEAARIERLVNDLLDLARMRATEFAVSREPLDLAQVAAEAVERHGPRARALGVELTDESVPAPGTGDPERALQAVSNLVENALRVVPAGGRVTVAARPGQIEVRDDGPGIAAEDVPRAFERSFLHARGRRPGTAGLGLALVRELATAMGGDVRLESAPGRTVFTLSM